jgi:flavin reductase (DIM6/NTAB) family NADH-FMN oxidoreductase RutF
MTANAEAKIAPAPATEPGGLGSHVLTGRSDADKRQFRNLLGQFATGVAVITGSMPEGRRIGVTVNSFSSVSLDPPLVLWSIATESPNLAAFGPDAVFAVNILASDQEEVARQFARSGEDKFQGLGVRHGLEGVSLLEGCVAYLECRVQAHYDGGDHVIILGAVHRYINLERDPLLFHRGSFHRLTETR